MKKTGSPTIPETRQKMKKQYGRTSMALFFLRCLLFLFTLPVFAGATENNIGKEIQLVASAQKCEDSGACTLPNGQCGAECNGQCLSFSEARCCMSGMCYRNGSWCGGVECNGQCMSPDEARCCLAGGNYVNGNCKHGGS